jgi:hypothetical protein
MKDNNQSDNLRALIDAGARSFKIEGRYKDMGYVKNITAHYRTLLDEIIEEREASSHPLSRSSSGRTTFGVCARPAAKLQPRVHRLLCERPQGRTSAPSIQPQEPGPAPSAGSPRWAPTGVELEVQTTWPLILHNGDGLCYHDLHKELVGMADQPRRAGLAAQHRRSGACFPKTRWRASRTCARAPSINRNRDMDWVRVPRQKIEPTGASALWVQLAEQPTAA